MGTKELELFDKRWTIRIRKMISKNRYIVLELSSEAQRLTGSRTTFKGTAGLIQKFFQRAS